MQYTEYGKTGKKVSAVGFGGMRFDQGGRSDEQNAEVVRHACSQGINYFDTAPGYGKSEDIFGVAFRDMPGEYYVSTKGMPVTYDTAAKARDGVRTSLDRMGVDKIHFYHIWCLRAMEHYELAMRPGGQYEGLLACQEEGLIDHIVCSSHQPGAEVRQIVEDGKVEGVLLGINILNFQYRWEGVEAAHKAGCAVVAMNPLGGGTIPQRQEELSFLASEGETPVEAALRFAIACPEITVTLVGFTTVEQVLMARRIADDAKAFTPEEMDRVARRVHKGMDAACTGCGYCSDCPEEIPIPSYMLFYNDRQMFGKSDQEMKTALTFDHNWGTLVGRKAEAAACAQCGRCEEACTQHLNITERLEQIAVWEKQLADGAEGS